MCAYAACTKSGISKLSGIMSILHHAMNSGQFFFIFIPITLGPYIFVVLK